MVAYTRSAEVCQSPSNVEEGGRGSEVPTSQELLAEGESLLFKGKAFGRVIRLQWMVPHIIFNSSVLGVCVGEEWIWGFRGVCMNMIKTHCMKFRKK